QSSIAGSEMVIQAVTGFLSLICLWWYLHRRLCRVPLKVRGAWFTDSLRMVGRGRWLFFSGIAIYIYTTLEQPMLGWLRPVEELGQYRSGLLLSGLVGVILSIFQQLLFPRYVAWRQEGRRVLW